MAAKGKQAVAYMRSSSASNVGTDKDSDKRQRTAIETFAKANGYDIEPEDWFYDVATMRGGRWEATQVRNLLRAQPG